MSEDETAVLALVRALESSGARWAFVGAAARNTWAPPRLTTDLDLAVLADLETWGSGEVGARDGQRTSG